MLIEIFYIKIESSLVSFIVTVTCRPEAEVDFYHGDEKVSAGGRFKLKQDKDVYSLIISDLRLEDAGEWSCQATNAFGKTQCSCDVQVLGKSCLSS